MFLLFSSLSFFSSVKSDHSSLLIDLCRTLLMVFWTFFGHFFVCEIGEFIICQFEMFNSELCQCNWYLCSIKMQRMLMVFISITQQPTIIQTIGHQLCARSTFKSVIHTCEILDSELFCRIFLTIFFFSSTDYSNWILLFYRDASNR